VHINHGAEKKNLALHSFQLQLNFEIMNNETQKLACKLYTERGWQQKSVLKQQSREIELTIVQLLLSRQRKKSWEKQRCSTQIQIKN
jgi:hypothetical protein